MSITSCPECGSTNIYYDASKDEHECLSCKHKWQKGVGMGLRELVEKYSSPLEKRVAEEMRKITERYGVSYKSDLGYMEFPRPGVSSSKFNLIVVEVEQKLRELGYDEYNVFETTIVVDFPGEIKAYEEWKRAGRPTSSHSFSPEVGHGDLASIEQFIKDENSDVRKYNDAATYLKSPEAKALAVEFAFDEMRHATSWKDLKAKLEREMER